MEAGAVRRFWRNLEDLRGMARISQAIVREGGAPMVNPAVPPQEADVRTTRVRTARLIAMAADVLQIAVFPMFAGGAASPINDALDVVVAGAVTWLVGWHWSFLPSFVAELVPGLDLVPTWTAAVFFATRRRGPLPPGSPTFRPPPPAGSIDAEVISSEPAPSGTSR